jgi:hypothetical protein
MNLLYVEYGILAGSLVCNVCMVALLRRMWRELKSMSSIHYIYQTEVAAYRGGGL